MAELALRYGTNPHQSPARACAERLPFRVVNGQPGAINLLDALNGWQLVRELRTATDLPAAASFKHVSPSGAALGLALDETDKRACMVEDMDLTPLAAAYARARGGDRLCSYLDWAAASDPLDVATARLLAREACDGVVAPGYEDGAVAILQQKRGGRFCVLEIDPSFEPAPVERREVFGVTIEQPRNTTPISSSLLDHVVTRASIPPTTRRDLLLALCTAKYTQSNSVCLARDGQTIGVGAGQQSRVHCVRLAAEKAHNWHLRRHPSAMSLPFRAGIRRPDRDNAIDGYVRGGLTNRERAQWLEFFEREPDPFEPDAKSEWLSRLTGVALASDGLFPFRDNIDVASTAGVVSIAQPGGSTRDQDIVAACDEYGMSMSMTGLRLFHH